MKYLQINSDFIDREFNKILQNALQGIKHTVSDSRAKGEMDCVMSTFGKQFDEFTENYVIDHIKVSRKFNHRDNVTPEILRVLNTYKKVGVHKMFEKLYPKAFIKRQVRRAPLLNLSTGDIKNTIASVLNNLTTSRSAALNKKDATSRLLTHLEDSGIKNISHYFNGEPMDLIGASSALRSLFVKANGYYEDIVTQLRRGDFDFGNHYDMEEPDVPQDIKLRDGIMQQLEKEFKTTTMPYFTLSGTTFVASTEPPVQKEQEEIKPFPRPVNIQPIPVQKINRPTLRK